MTIARYKLPRWNGSECVCDCGGDIPCIPTNSAVDIYLITDISGSFSDDLPNISSFLTALTGSFGGPLFPPSNVAVGLGFFSDVPFEPYGDPFIPDIPFINSLNPTTDYSSVISTFNSISVLSGADFPESQLNALVGAGTLVAYRPGSIKVIILITDAEYHTEETGYHNSVAQAALAMSGNIVLFLVTGDQILTYQNLLAQMGNMGDVQEIIDDSSNIVESFFTAINNAVGFCDT